LATVDYTLNTPGNRSKTKTNETALSEKNFMDLIQSSPDAVFVYVEGSIIFVNKAGMKLLRAENPEDIIGHDVWEFVPQQSHKALKKAISLIINHSRSCITSEDKMITVDGGIIDVEVSSTYFNFNGKHGIQAFVRDISKRKSTEEQLRKSTQEYRQIVELTGTAILFIEEDRTISLVNGECEKISGYRRDEIEGKKKWTEFIAPEDLWMLERSEYTRRRNKGVPVSMEFRLIDRHKKYHNAFMTISTIPGSRRSMASIIDLTEIQKAQEMLATARQNYRILVENTKEAIAIIQDEYVRYVNPKLCEITGYTEEEIINKKFYKLVHRDFNDFVRREYRYRLDGAEAGTMLPVKIIDTEKNERWFQINSVLTLWWDKPAVLLFFNDITETKKAQDAMKASEERYRLLAENADDIIVIYDQEGTIEYINTSGRETFGSDRTVPGRDKVTDILNLTPEFRPMSLVKGRHPDGSTSFKNRVEVMRPDGAIMLFETISNPITMGNNKPGMLVIARDCTERKKLEKEIIQISERIRHQVSRDLHDDLNPHLIGIEALCQVLSMSLRKLKLPEADEAQKIAELINKAITMTYRLARGLCPVDLESTGIQTPLMNLMKVIRSLYGIECMFDYDNNIIIEDITLSTNLYYIAQEATLNAARYSGGSRISITLKRIDDFFVLSVEDNGSGISKKKKKPADETGKNSGMGLKIMKYRAEIIDGILQISRNRPSGTIISVKMPINILKSEGRISYGGRYTNQQQKI